MAKLLHNPFSLPWQKRVFVYETTLLLTEGLRTASIWFQQRGNMFLAKRCPGQYLWQTFYIFLACQFFSNVLVIGSKNIGCSGHHMKLYTLHESIFFNLLKIIVPVQLNTHCNQSPTTHPPPTQHQLTGLAHKQTAHLTQPLFKVTVSPPARPACLLVLCSLLAHVSA